VAASPESAGPAAATDADAVSVGRAYFETIARRDLDAMEAFYEPGGTGELHGLVELHVPGNYRQWFGDLLGAFPDLKMEILDVVGGDEVAAVRWRASGSFTGACRFEGLEPNGARVTMSGCDVIRVRDGRIYRNDAYTNGADLARQLGALPPQGSLPERAMTGALNLKTKLGRRFGR
jgi:predicted ester cyclase